MITEQALREAIKVAHRAADSRNMDIVECKITITFPFYIGGDMTRPKWHCLLDSGIDDGGEWYSHGEFLGVGDSVEAALGCAVDDALGSIRDRSQLDVEFLRAPLVSVP